MRKQVHPIQIVLAVLMLALFFIAAPAKAGGHGGQLQVRGYVQQFNGGCVQQLNGQCVQQFNQPYVQRFVQPQIVYQQQFAQPVYVPVQQFNGYGVQQFNGFHSQQLRGRSRGPSLQLNFGGRSRGRR
jgi:hypothetical protein